MAGKAAAALAALLIGAAAVAQDQSPESLLPPGFGDTPSSPVPGPSPTSSPADGARPAGPAIDLPLPAPSASPSPTASPSPIDPATLAMYEMPAFARRSLDIVGAAGSAEGGLQPDAFGLADGRWLQVLMRRATVPVPSRWMAITLRRALASRVDTPARVNGADFAAERAWLLLRMGESVAARALVQAVDTGNATPKLRQVAMQAALATGDPGGVCPLVPGALADRREAGWVLAQAMCAGISGDARAATPLIRQAKRRLPQGIDVQLAEKVIGAGANSRQAITIEWQPVTQLTAWRFGLATATGVTVPETLYATVGPQVTGWRALTPAIPLADRAAIADRAAAMGMLSSDSLVDLYAALEDSEEAPAALSAAASDLRTAFAANSRAGRIAALRELWGEGTAAGAREAAAYARLILTARAAARIPVGADVDAEGAAADTDRLVSAMLSAGLDRTAQKWRGRVAEGGDAWAMLTLADPDARGQVSYAALSDYAGSGDAARKQRLFFAGLAGLGRLSVGDVERAARALEVRIGFDNAWVRAIKRAATRRETGTVVLLAAIGMQTSDWRGVPAESLYHIVTALRVVGLEGEARMIATEAIART